MKASIYILIFGVIVAGFIIFSSHSTTTSAGEPSVSNVTIENGQQIITISAKGGYTPRLSTAKAGIPTVLRFKTSGTFDCSASVRIPSQNIVKLLPQSGATDITLGTPAAGPLLGTCGMGMYRFEVDFQG